VRFDVIVFSGVWAGVVLSVVAISFAGGTCCRGKSASFLLNINMVDTPPRITMPIIPKITMFLMGIFIAKNGVVVKRFCDGIPAPEASPLYLLGGKAS
jgi:hypothetical protein